MARPPEQRDWDQRPGARRRRHQEQQQLEPGHERQRGGQARERTCCHHQPQVRACRVPGKFILFTRACFRLANSHGPAVSRGAGPKSNHSSSPSPKLPPVPVTKSKTPVSSVSPPVRAPSQSARPVTSVRSALSSPAKPPPPKQQQPPVLTLDNNG